MHMSIVYSAFKPLVFYTNHHILNLSTYIIYLYSNIILTAIF